MPPLWFPYGIGPHPDDEKHLAREATTVERDVIPAGETPWLPDPEVERFRTPVYHTKTR